MRLGGSLFGKPAGSDAGSGSAQLHLLAQLTRLRRAACDPRLVTPELSLAGAKVRAFGELAREPDRWKGAAFGGLIGLYDGFFGPGTGSFFIFFFIRYLKADFLHASALSKIANLTTNVAALSFFAPTGHVLFAVGGMMAIANVLGSIVGVRAALKYGSGFIRILFLILVSVLIVRLGYQTLTGQA